MPHYIVHIDTSSLTDDSELVEVHAQELEVVGQETLLRFCGINDKTVALIPMKRIQYIAVSDCEFKGDLIGPWSACPSHA